MWTRLENQASVHIFAPVYWGYFYKKQGQVHPKPPKKGSGLTICSHFRTLKRLNTDEASSTEWEFPSSNTQHWRSLLINWLNREGDSKSYSLSTRLISSGAKKVLLAERIIPIGLMACHKFYSPSAQIMLQREEPAKLKRGAEVSFSAKAIERF